MELYKVALKDSPIFRDNFSEHVTFIIIVVVIILKIYNFRLLRKLYN